MSKQTVLTPEQKVAMKASLKEICKTSKESLKAQVLQQRRVIDLSKATKNDLISIVFEIRWGRNRVEAYFA